MTASALLVGTPQALVRRLGADDAVDYRALMLRGVREHPDRFRLTEADIRDEFPPLGFSADGFTLGAYVEGRLAGVVSIAREARIKTRHKALLYRMYVASEQAGLGLGRQLVVETVKAARGLDGLRHLNLTVLSDNVRALTLYRSLGFATFAREPAAVFADGHYREEQQMKLILQETPPTRQPT